MIIFVGAFLLTDVKARIVPRLTIFFTAMARRGDLSFVPFPVLSGENRIEQGPEENQLDDDHVAESIDLEKILPPVVQYRFNWVPPQNEETATVHPIYGLKRYILDQLPARNKFRTTALEYPFKSLKFSEDDVIHLDVPDHIGYYILQLYSSLSIVPEDVPQFEASQRRQEIDPTEWSAALDYLNIRPAVFYEDPVGTKIFVELYFKILCAEADPAQSLYKYRFSGPQEKHVLYKAHFAKRFTFIVENVTNSDFSDETQLPVVNHGRVPIIQPEVVEIKRSELSFDHRILFDEELYSPQESIQFAPASILMNQIELVQKVADEDGCQISTEFWTTWIKPSEAANYPPLFGGIEHGTPMSYEDLEAFSDLSLDDPQKIILVDLYIWTKSGWN